MRDVAVTAGTLPRRPCPPSPATSYPIFERLSRLQWVNAGFAAGFGWESAVDFTTSDWVGAAARPQPGQPEQRARVLTNSFRARRGR